MSDIPTSLSAVRRVVVVRPNHRLGNALLLIPLVIDLERRFPDAEIELVTTGSAAFAVFKGFPRVTAIHAFPENSFHSPVKMLQLIMLLKGRRFDLAIDPMIRSRAGRFLLSQLRATHRLGFVWGEAGRDRSLTLKVDPRDAPAHFARAPLHLTSTVLGSSGLVPDATLRLGPAELRAGRLRLAATFGGKIDCLRPTVGLFAHATGSKIIPAEWWRQLAGTLRREAPHLHLLEFVPADGRPRIGGDVAAIHTPDLRLLGATLAATSVLVSADCGLMHLADAAGARVLALFKTTDPARYGPSGALGAFMQVSDHEVSPVAAKIRDALLVPNPSEPAPSSFLEPLLESADRKSQRQAQDEI